jgi:hypothetical protein
MVLFTITAAPRRLNLGIIFAKITDGPGRTKLLAAVAAIHASLGMNHHHHTALVLEHPVGTFAQTDAADGAFFVIDYRIPVFRHLEHLF